MHLINTKFQGEFQCTNGLRGWSSITKL